jgi:hypothetical protein
MADPTPTTASPESTASPAQQQQEDFEQDVPHVCKNQYILISMPSGNVKMMNLKEDT